MNFLEWLLGPLQYGFMQHALVAAMIVGVVSAVVGSFLLVKQWALLGDAISHAVLPGVAIAFLLGWPFFVGAVVTGLLTALGIGFVERNSRIRQDAAMGLLFVSAFALGLAIISRIQSPVDLFHILFGNVLAVSRLDLLLTAATGIVVVGAIALLYKELLLWAFDPIMAESVGLPVRRLHYLMILLTSLTIVASLQAVGIVLVVAMLIAPAATAYLLTDRFHRMILLAALLGALSGVAGLYLSFYLDVASGATMVLVGATLFSASLLFAPKHGIVPKALRRRRARSVAFEDDHLKHLLALSRSSPVAAEALTDRLGEGVASVARTVRRLERSGLVHRSFEGVALTAKGLRRAMQVVRTHRLWERYLVDRGGIPSEEVHAAADRLEHASSPELTDRLDEALGCPTVDPHGAPIPRGEESILIAEGYLLSELHPGQEGTIAQVEDEDPELLYRLSSLGMVPGARVRALAVRDGGLEVMVAGQVQVIDRRIARSVLVLPEKGPEVTASEPPRRG
ncbi:MAG: iron chelate uptake ABC transporter family permease subunit [Candidatus Methylomirabilales bacterium]